MTRPALAVGVVGCGLIGGKRAAALAPHDVLVGVVDTDPAASALLARRFGVPSCATAEDLIDRGAQVVVVATPHDQLRRLGEVAIAAGADVLIEKPAGLGVADIDALDSLARREGRLVKVGFNHRFHPAIARAVGEARSGAHGDVLHLRARYGHGGRVGYDREWRADPRHSGGGELIDQGMHLIDISGWALGQPPLHSALLRTQYWDTPVDDNAALILGDGDSRTGAWAMLHATWTEWKNMFSLEIYCRTGKLQVDGLAASYGRQRLQVFKMRPEMGPPDVETVEYPHGDESWQAEWEHFAGAVAARDGRALLGDLQDARYAWTIVEASYRGGPYAGMREEVAP